MKLAIFNSHLPQNSFASALKAPGCTLGRGQDNTIVLKDPSTRISLIQAIIKIQHNLVSISNMGQHPIHINGRELAFTKETPLEHEDIIRIAHYLILCDFAQDSLMSTTEHEHTLASPQRGMAISPRVHTSPQNQTTVQALPSSPLTVMPMSSNEPHHAPLRTMLTANPTVLPLESSTSSGFDSIAESLSTPEPIAPTTITPEPITPLTPLASAPISASDPLNPTALSVPVPPMTETVSVSDCLTSDPLSASLSTIPVSESIPPIDKPATVADPFADLLSGPGVVPVGADVDLQQLNPFELASATTRNSANPIELLEAQSIQHNTINGEVLSIFSQDGTEQDKKTIFYDTTPSTVSTASADTFKKEDDILDILHTLSYEELVRK